MSIFNSTKLLNRRSSLQLALSVALLSLSGCMLPDDKPAEPKGRLQVVHANPQEGAIEVLVDDELLVTVSPDSVSEVVKLNQGEWVLSLRKAGAASAYFTTEAINFGDQLNVIAITIDEIKYVTDEAPPVEEGTHHVRVFDLTGSDQEVTLFRGRTEITTLPIEGRLSAFLPTEPGEAEAYALSDAASRAPLFQDSVSVNSPVGGASLVIVSAGAEDDSFKLKVLTLR
jgi:hypothetical protein